MTGTNNQVSGLAGSNSGPVSGSYAKGNVEGMNNNVGGLVGSNNSAVLSSYSKGNVTGRDYLGGLVGSNIGEVSGSDATGSVTGTEMINCGALMGWNNGTVTSTYWNKSANPELDNGIGVGDGEAIGLTEEGMKRANKFEKFDFNNTWTILEGAENLHSDY